MIRFERCPFCTQPVTSTRHSGASTLIECGSCGAAWEQHGVMLRRIHDGELLTQSESTVRDQTEPAPAGEKLAAAMSWDRRRSGPRFPFRAD